LESLQLMQRATYPTPLLSKRELQVLQTMADGLRCKHAAGVLGITTETIRKHRARVIGKLGARNAVEAVSKAFEQGLLMEPAAPLSKVLSRSPAARPRSPTC
jgi:DNA-binding CsgD family transcriptional regulator